MDNFIPVKPPVFPLEKIVVPEAISVRLKNGVPVFMIESGTEDILRLEFTFRAGQIKESSPLISSTTNAMLSEGSETYSSEEMNRILDFYGAFLNLSAEKDRAGVVIYLLNKHIDKILELSREIIFRPTFPEKELNALMNKRLRWFLVNREKVQNIAMDKFFESVFGKSHPYGKQLSEADFGNITSELIKDFHSKYYRPENMAIIISGKIPADSFDLLNSYFGDLPVNSSFSLVDNFSPIADSLKKVHLDKAGAVQSAIRIGSQTINKRHPDYPGLKVLDSILGGYFGSRLMKNIREDKGYTYGIGCSVSSLDLAGFKVISTEVGLKYCDAAVEEIYKEIKKLHTIHVNNDELEVVKNYMSGELLRMFDGPFAQAESFRSVWDFGLDNDYYYRLAEKIKTIKGDEILWLANTYYNIEDLYQITVGSK